MTSKATSPTQYLSELPEERKAPMKKLRDILKKNLPKGFEETMQYGMLSWVVPHKIFPAGYHCDPKQALPFVSLASQKNYIALYHMGIYANPALLKWYTDEFPKFSKRKLDMGKGCLRFKYMDDIPYNLVEELAKKITVEEWIKVYQKNLTR